MKFFILLAIVASAAAVPAIVSTGNSAVSRSDDGLGNYAFGYNEDHATGGTFRKEQGGPGVQIGSYGLRDADGRVRTVNYVADALGYRASISTNEPGVDPAQPAAATTLNGAAPLAPAVAVAPVAAYAAPVVKSYAAPVAAYAAAPVAYAPQIAVAAPIASSYASSVQHASIAAPAVYAAPVAAYAAPVAYAKSYAAPLVSSYSVQHGPVGYAGKIY
ncbi:PREDICTED: adult-specific rigid cuticular protein 15.7-like [Rhagoletis zephyria]|uniref:adult-specific rigid cuticular protein 15.7-like n=1 Tax=Rhagoletis zephyria TaxID=28612 RepID=UPI00081183C7|nr:PREDICTED: adult-specific rigid cuticular protein 15.7-like [Rhagoletis zephyria]